MRRLSAIFSLCILMSATSLAAQVNSSSFNVNIHLTLANTPRSLTNEMIRDVSRGVCSLQTTAANSPIVCIIGQSANITTNNEQRFVNIDSAIPLNRYMQQDYLASVKKVDPTRFWALSRLNLGEKSYEGTADEALEFLVNF